MSIKTKLLIFALSISLIPISIITTVDYINTRNTLKYHAMNEMSAIAESKKLHLLSFIDAKKGRTIDFSSDGFIRDSLEMISRRGTQSHAVPRLNRHLTVNKMSLDPFILQIDVVGIDGRIVSSTTEASIGRKVSDYERLKQLLSGRYSDTYFKEPHYSQTLDRTAMDFAAPLFPQNGGNPVGFIILHYEPSILNLITGDRTGMGETGEVYIVNREKKMLTESRFIKDVVLSQIVDTEPVRRIVEDDNDGMTGIYPDYRGVPIVGAAIDIPEYGWVLLAEVDKAEAFALISLLRVYAIGTGCVSALLIIVLVIVISRGITHPIQKLVEGTKKIASGDLGFIISTRTKDEIGSLANSFNEMTTQLKESKRQIDDYAHNLEQKVKDKTKEIKQMLDELMYKNKELEQIVYVTSHDLRSPLLNIQGFSRELQQSFEQVQLVLNESSNSVDANKKLAETLEEDIPDALKFILASSSKMDTLLAGLLRLSRMGRVVLTFKRLDMNKLMANVVETFEYKIKEAGITFHVDELPSCRGDEAQIGQVFSNLIDNALKYLDPDRKGVIRISGTRQLVYCVEDNGIGINMSHQNNIFEIFHRLNPGDGTTGEGLGLTIVRKILDRHGGKTWVESKPGKGSRFFVWLPE